MDDEGKEWKKLYDSLAEANIRLEKTISERNAQIEIMKSLLENAQKSVDLSKLTLKQGFTEFNTKEQEYITLINALKNKLKELGYANINKLGS